MKTILVTGSAGFIGYHLSKILLEAGHEVVGYDSLNAYYDVSLKEARLALLYPFSRFTFIKADIEDQAALSNVFKQYTFDCVIHLAAQAGVRYSLSNPREYIKSNLVGFFNMIDLCKENEIPHFLYASSSSVYGANKKYPFYEYDQVDTPLSLYAATKKSNELLAHSYGHIYGLRTTGFRFFTVYGPYGRPDMALFHFTKNIIEGNQIDIYNHGNMHRDFTYIDDIVQSIVLLIDNSASVLGKSPYNIYNIGNSNPVKLMDFVDVLETELGKKAIIRYLPMQPGDVETTYANTEKLRVDTGFSPSFDIKEGIRRFVSWYRTYYKI